MILLKCVLEVHLFRYDKQRYWKVAIELQENARSVADGVYTAQKKYILLYINNLFK